MLKTPEATLVMLLLWAPCLGQTVDGADQKPVTYLGIGAGISASWLTVSGLPSSYAYQSNPGTGYRFALLIKHEFSHFSLEGSLGYTQEHNSLDYTMGSVQSTAVQYSFSWIDLPVKLNYAFLQRDKFSVFVGAGLSVRKLIQSSRQTTTVLGNGFTVSGESSGGVNSWTVFPGIQCGTHVPVGGNSRISITLGYEWNASSLFEPVDVPAGVTAIDPGYALRSFVLNVTYSVDWQSL